MAKEHTPDEFGQHVPTVVGGNFNDPDLTALSSTTAITLAGVDEQATASERLAPPTPRPGVDRIPLWVWAVALVVMFVIGALGLWYAGAHGMLYQAW